MPTKTDLAYIAGLIDGDGYMDIHKTNYSGSGVPRIIITNNNKSVLEWTKKIISSLVSNSYLYRIKENHYHLVIQSRKNLKVLIPLLLPYLKIKKEKAIKLLGVC